MRMQAVEVPEDSEVDEDGFVCKRLTIPEIVCAREQTRYSMALPWLDVERRFLVATDGKALVAIRVDVEDGDVSGPVPVGVLRYMRDRGVARGRFGASRIEVEDGASFPRDVADAKFPRWDEVVPSADDARSARARITVNPTLLAEVAEAIGSPTGVEVRDVGPGRAMVVTRHDGRAEYGGVEADAVAIIMPLWTREVDEAAAARAEGTAEGR